MLLTLLMKEIKCFIKCHCFNRYNLATSKTQARTLDPGPGLWTRTLDPDSENLDPEKPGP